MPWEPWSPSRSGVARLTDGGRLALAERLLLSTGSRAFPGRVAEAGGLVLTLRSGPNQDRISAEGSIVRKVYKTLSEADGTYTWTSEFGFWVPRGTLSVRRVRWIENYTAVNAP